MITLCGSKIEIETKKNYYDLHSKKLIKCSAFLVVGEERVPFVEVGVARGMATGRDRELRYTAYTLVYEYTRYPALRLRIHWYIKYIDILRIHWYINILRIHWYINIYLNIGIASIHWYINILLICIGIICISRYKGI
jgi:hypothetical protein